MTIKGQGNSLTVVQGHSDSTYSNFFSLETAEQIEAKVHVKPPWDEWMKVSTNALCPMNKMAAIPIKIKTFKNLLLWNQKADDLESWYPALVTRVLPNLIKWWLRVDLDLFYSKVEFGPFCVLYGKDLQETIEASEVKVGTHSQVNEYVTVYDNTMSR